MKEYNLKSWQELFYNYFYLKNEEAVRHIERHRQRKDGLLVSSGLCFIKEIKFF